jgi:radical SAM superfamily enzyme YgiQ (UPF0313 family)
MYKMKRFKILDLEVIRNEVRAIPEVYRRQIRKIFLADGDALVLGYESLHQFLLFLGEQFPRLRRIAIYATPKNILALTHEQLATLQSLNLRLLYMGLESGHDPLLQFINKGNDCQSFVSAACLAREAGLKLSVTAILGLGGKEFSHQHAIDTALAVNQSTPEYFSLLTLIKGGNEKYIEKLHLLNRRELLLELRQIIEKITVDTIFRTDHSSNFIDLGGTLQKDRQKLLDKADLTLAKPKLLDWLDTIPQHFGEGAY